MSSVRNRLQSRLQRATLTHSKESFDADAIVDQLRDSMDTEEDAAETTSLRQQLEAVRKELSQVAEENEQLKLSAIGLRSVGSMESINEELDFERREKEILAKDVAVLRVQLHALRTAQRQQEERQAGGGGWVALVRRRVEVLSTACIEQALELVHELQDSASADVAAEAAVPVDDELAVKKLRNNVQRFTTGLEPLWEAISGFNSVTHWRNPPYSLAVFAVYMYFAYCGLALQLFLFLVLLRLGLNYLRYQLHWQIDFHYLRRWNQSDADKPSLKDEFKNSSKISEKINIVMLVARKVQNNLGRLADSLEKLKNLFTWQQPEATMYLFKLLALAFVVSLVLPVDWFIRLAAVGLGVKLFLVDTVYDRCPRLRQKYDRTHIIWQALPTDADVTAKKRAQKIAEQMIPLEAEVAEQLDEEFDVLSSSDAAPDQLSPAAGQVDGKVFTDTFGLPATEQPLAGWEHGRKCAIIDRDKGLLSGAIKPVRLYLTRSFLCFERLKGGKKGTLIALTDITKIQKTKGVSWIPGNGMAIEVTMKDADKPYVIGGLISRDDCFQSICLAGQKAHLSWATAQGGGSATVAAAAAATGGTAAPTSRSSSSSPTLTPRKSADAARDRSRSPDLPAAAPPAAAATAKLNTSAISLSKLQESLSELDESTGLFSNT